MLGNVNYSPETQIADIVIREKNAVAMYENTTVKIEISSQAIEGHTEKSKKEGRVVEDKENAEYWYNKLSKHSKIKPQVGINPNAKNNLEFLWKYFSKHINEIPQEIKEGFEGIDEKTLIGYYIASRPETIMEKFIREKTKEEGTR